MAMVEPFLAQCTKVFHIKLVIEVLIVLVPSTPRVTGYSHAFRNMEDQTESPDRETQPQHSKRRVAVSSACQRCRKRKLRCDGQRPACANCAKHDATCDYENVRANETRAVAAKRHAASLQAQIDGILNNLTELKLMSDDDALAWLSKLRSASDPLAALSSLKKEPIDDWPIATSRQPPVLNSAPTTPYPNLEMRLSLQHPHLYPSTPLYGHSVNSSRLPKDAFNESLDDRSELEILIRGYATDMLPRSKALSGEVEWQAELCDSRLRQLDISHWTPVNISDELAAQLLSHYFSTDHRLLSPFDADLFIDDLTSRTLRFCSPLLVNSVLAWTCTTYSTSIELPADLASKFVTVAERLLRSDENNASVLNVASLFCLTLASICSGRDMAAMTYLRQTLEMAILLRLHGENSATTAQLGLFHPHWIRAYGYVAWGSYNFACVHMSHYRIAEFQKYVARAPQLPIPGDQALYEIFPDSSPPPYMDQTFAQYCRLLPINEGILYAYLGPGCAPDKAVPLAFAEEKYQRLLEWADQLPHSLARTPDMAHHMIVLHVSFHSMVMELFRPFLFKNLKLASLANARPEEVFLASSARIVEVTRLYYTKFRGTPFTRTATWLIAPIYTANISLRGSPDTWVQRKQDFELAMRSLMEIGMIAAMKEGIVRGSFVMAVNYGLLSRGEAREMLHQVLAAKGSTFQPDHPGTVLTIDFERAVDDPTNSSAQALLKDTSLLMTEKLHARASSP
ncbi:Nitrogen assimilation transcription factor nit-4 [Pseudocercospora fuligena]|uniref:Nitrogen assimilation transcription factor nit-4 n=1 Tax=Pseudocercospora fuligena TaxID=685502 RepID=A0A8H6RPL7_9PEZI|nr:Nitrogen assimilation transcription factor nit-4 [Pseudocercospora fuligena]